MTKENRNHDEIVLRCGETSLVFGNKGYAPHVRGEVICEVKNTGNGYIILFPSHTSTEQDYYVCLDYAQAYDMILGLSAFKKELGFKE
jgi:hypothetical protein